MGSEDQLQLELDDVMAKRQHLILVLSCQGRWQEHYYPRRRESKNLPCLTAKQATFGVHGSAKCTDPGTVGPRDLVLPRKFSDPADTGFQKST